MSLCLAVSLQEVLLYKLLQKMWHRVLKLSSLAGEVKVLENSQETKAQSQKMNTLGQEEKTPTSRWGSLKVVLKTQVVFVVSLRQVTLRPGVGTKAEVQMR